MTEDKIMLSLSDTNILGYDTPSSIHLSVADIIGEFTYSILMTASLTSAILFNVGPILS